MRFWRTAPLSLTYLRVDPTISAQWRAPHPESLEEFMKLTWMFAVIVVAVLGMAAGYELTLAREHQRLEKNKELVRAQNSLCPGQ